MVNIKTLLPGLRGLVKDLAEDLLARSTADAEINAKQRQEYQKIRNGGRTGQPFEEWRDDFLDQVAVAWVLACVFVRFMEDNDLINERFLAGEGDQGKMAEGAHELYFRSHPHESDREYLEYVFREIRRIPAAAELFAEGKTPVWALAPSGDASKRLLDFFREIDAEEGGLRRSFVTKGWDTQPIVDVYEKLDPQARFLGDLYQDLSEHARKKFALLQTPGFVEEFILDRTLNLAIGEFGLKGLRMIDPTCGSGHFLLGAFARLFREWMKPEHGIDNPVIAAQNALDGVWGVDINPFAVAITRFRLLVAAVNACGIKKLNQQSYAWTVHLATGDSLLWGSKPTFGGNREPILRQVKLFEEIDPIYAVEDPDALREVLGQGYHVVVGNPPYITVKDRAQNEAYREMYTTCHRQYSLGVPFTQRFWELAIRKGERNNQEGEPVAPHPGFVGMITANSFMKREFGKKLIEDFFPKIDLTHVLDTSKAHIPGHGTPTVILFGRSRKPIDVTVRAVLAIKGESSTPDVPSQGLVWQSIVHRIDQVGTEDEFVSTTDVLRTTFANHPWSMGGGGAAELKATIDSNGDIELQNLVEAIGYYQDTHADEVFVQTKDFVIRHGLESGFRSHVRGEEIRNWSASQHEMILFPFDENIDIWGSFPLCDKWTWLYCQKTGLHNRSTFGGSTYRSSGRPWFDYHQFPKDRARRMFLIAYAFFGTDNHFVFGRGSIVFNRSAPLVILKNQATEDDYYDLLGLLNSSIALFWFKQTFHNKGGGGINGGIAAELWEHFYEYTAAGLQRFPIPEQRSHTVARLLDRLGRDYSSSLPDAFDLQEPPTQDSLKALGALAGSIRGRMIALQEELDWQCYYLYGLFSEVNHLDSGDIPELALGERAFEIVMARRVARGELVTSWFERHGSTPITQLPNHWPVSYRNLIEHRIRLFETNKDIELIERPEHKRRWNDESWQDMEQRVLRSWLLNRLESTRYWICDKGDDPVLQSTAELADIASGDHEFLQVAALFRGRPDFDVTALVSELVESESVPFLPILRHKPSGLRKREVWERTWDLQRKEDIGEGVGEIPVPPKYATVDFLKNEYWRLRGKLDVPKERWVSYPHLQTESDPSLVVGWAGWDHLQQATALVSYYDARKREGWDGKRLAPILAGLDQLLPWIHQWHPEIDPEFGETAGQSYQALLENDTHELGLTLDDIRNWQPPQTTTRRRART